MTNIENTSCFEKQNKLQVFKGQKITYSKKYHLKKCYLKKKHCKKSSIFRLKDMNYFLDGRFEKFR